MKDRWFLKIGWFYAPLNTAGWLVTLAALVCCVWMFFIIDQHTHSVTETFINYFPILISVFAVRNWIASNTCD